MIQEANTQGLHSTIFPTLHFNKDADEWWQEAKRDSAWWDVWFERYQTFITYHADAATAGNASALILGGDLIYPALPDGKLSDGTSSGVPEDAIDRWSNIIAAAHQHYSGKIYWAASFERGLNTASELITQTDGLYLLWSAPLTNELDPEENSLVEKMGTLLDEEIQPFHELNGGKCILAVSYASANGAASGCIPGEENKCISPARLDRPYADIPVVNVDLQEQVDLYNAIFTAVNQRNWIDGIVSRNFYYPAALQDKSASVNGKPALDVIWYWFPGLSAQ
jgi:hypothetical protein